MRVSGRTVLALTGAAAVCGAAAAVIAGISSSRNPVATATIVAGDLAAVAVAVTLLLAVGAWWQRGRPGGPGRVSTPSQAAAAADRLAEEMADRWRQEAGRRRIVTPAPVKVRWRWAAQAAPLQDVTAPPAPGAGPPPLPDLGEPGEMLEAGVVIRLHDEVYARLPHGRLVLVGGPGAGKTGAMILLLLAALEGRARLTGEERAAVPVPVWLTLGRWDPAATSLREWAASRMNLDHPALRAPDYGPGAADELLRSGRVALFLDGLDEMPEATRPQALRRISEEAGRLRVVLTSRPDEYAWAAQFLRLWDNIAVIELRPVGPAEAADYLLQGQPGPRHGPWERVAAYLTAHPGSSAARTLDNPLALSLAREAYASRDPAELTDPAVFPTEAELRGYLIDQVLVTAYPGERQRAHVVRWLAWTAWHLGPIRDLAWWEIPAWIPRWQLRLARVLVIAVVVGLINGIGLDIVSALTTGFAGNLAIGLAAGLAHGMATGLILGLVFGIWLGRPGRARPRALIPRWPGSAGLRRVFNDGFTLGIGLLSAWTFGIIVGAAGFGPVAGLAVGALVLLAVEFRKLWSIPVADSRSATAAGAYRADRRATVLTGLTVGLVIGVAGGLSVVPVGFASPLANGLANGLPWALSILAAAWLVIGQAPRVWFTELVLACQRRERVRFLRLLEDAADRQVLRQAGVMYQFRHAALQDRLAALAGVASRPPPGPPPGTWPGPPPGTWPGPWQGPAPSPGPGPWPQPLP